IDHLLRAAQRFGLLGADFPQSPDDGHRVGGADLTAVIDAQFVLDFIGVFIALNDKQVEVGAPPRQREEQQGEEGQSEAFHTLLLGRTRARVAGRAPGGGHPGALAAWLGGPWRATALDLREHYKPCASVAQGCFDGTHMQKPLLQEILCLSAGSLSGPLLVSFFSITRKRSLWRRKPMTTPATRNGQESMTEGTLFVAFELSEKAWKLGFTTGHGQKPRERTVTARQQECVLDEIAQAKRRLGLSETAPVVSCYEAGRESFWLHRFLQGHG